jgi:hypothetical protein
MDESHVAGFTAVVRSLQRFCRIEDEEKRGLCQREVYERMLTEEIARGNEPDYIHWRLGRSEQIEDCYENCRLTGKNEVKLCNTRCLNSLVRDIWQRTNVPEFEAIAAKYSD